MIVYIYTIIYTYYIYTYICSYMFSISIFVGTAHANQEDLAALRMTLEEATKRELLVEDVSSNDPWQMSRLDQILGEMFRNQTWAHVQQIVRTLRYSCSDIRRLCSSRKNIFEL